MIIFKKKTNGHFWSLLEYQLSTLKLTSKDKDVSIYPAFPVRTKFQDK